jgi:HK97 family phage major capsid protein
MTLNENHASAPETKALVTEMNETLHALRQESEAEEASGRAPDPVSEEKFARMNARIDDIAIKMNRPVLGKPGSTKMMAEDRASLEQKAAFQTYMRTGQEEAIRRFEMKSNANLGPDPGYVLPPDVELGILSRMAIWSPLRAVANVQQVSGTSFRTAVSPNGATRGWTGDANPSNSPDTTFLRDLSYNTAELFCQPAATQTLLDDPAIDLESWIGGEVERAFALAEAATFISGNGVNKPKGFLAEPTVANASWAWGSLGFMSTGVSAGFPATNPSDVLIDFVHSLKTIYRQNASFVMNRKTQGAIRKFKDSTGNYLWQPPTMAGARATLMNFPVVEVEDMPDIAANSFSIAFGDFQRGYLIVDRIGIRALRDPYSAKPYVLFYTTKRIGGGVQDYDAIKLLRFAV